jgi:hypothetical protein
MFDQLLDSFRRMSESTMQAQQDMMRSWTHQWVTPQSGGMGPSNDWVRSYQNRFVELTTEALNRHRETLDAAYRAGIKALEETFRVSDSKSPDDYRRTAEELWRKLFDTFRTQYETQLQDLQKFTTASFEMAQQPQQQQQQPHS